MREQEEFDRPGHHHRWHKGGHGGPRPWVAMAGESEDEDREERGWGGGHFGGHGFRAFAGFGGPGSGGPGFGGPGSGGPGFGGPGSGGPGSGGPGSGGPGSGGPGPGFGGPGGPGFGGPGPGFGGPGFGGPPGRGGWGGWSGRGGWGRGGRGRARRGDVRAAVLLLVAEEPRNGYQIIGELAERSRGAWRPSPGSVYPVLQQLEDEGFVISAAADVGRVYRITEAGTAHLDAHRDEMGLPWEEAANAMSQPAYELAQLIPPVLGAIKQVLHAGTDRQIKQAADVLAQTRRSLYRILADDRPGPETPTPPEGEG